MKKLEVCNKHNIESEYEHVCEAEAESETKAKALSCPRGKFLNLKTELLHCVGSPCIIYTTNYKHNIIFIPKKSKTERKKR